MKLSKMTERLVGQPMFEIKNKIKEIEDGGNRVIRFEIGDSKTPVDKMIIGSTVYSLIQNQTGYSQSQGSMELRKEIAKKYRGIDTENVIIMPANSAIDAVVRCVCDKDDEVLVVSPHFPTYSSVLKYNGIKYREILPKNFELTAKNIKPGRKTKLLIINSPCNPTGRIVRVEEIDKILSIAKKHKFFVLFDNTYEEIRYNASEIDRLFFSLPNSIVIGSYSKSFCMSGFRVGYCIADKKLIEKINLLFQTTFSCLPLFVQLGAYTAEVHGEKIIESRVSELFHKRNIMVAELKKNGIIKCEYPDGAIYCFADISATGMTGDEFAKQLLEKEYVAVLPGSCFGKGLDNYIRLCFDTDEETIKLGTERINNFLNGRADGC